jgi:hypothetical protein
MEFCEFLLDTALDQANYMSDLLALDRLRDRIDRYIVARNDKRVPGVDAEIKPVAGLVLFNAFIQGSLDRKQAIALTGMHERSARRLLNQMKREGLLNETSNRSPLKWEIPEHADSATYHISHDKHGLLVLSKVLRQKTQYLPIRHFL